MPSKRDTPHFILSTAGDAFASHGSGVFLKDVLVEGVFQHPVNPWDEPLVVDEPYIDRIVAASNAAMNAGQRAYVPDGHSNRAGDNKGYVESFFKGTRPDGKIAAFARMRIEDASYIDKVGKTIKDVSPMIVSFPLGSGDSYGERIEHVALVPDPVMPGQGDFIACSLGSGTVDTVNVPVLKPLPGVNEMKIKVTDANLKALSLSGTAVKVGDEVDVPTIEKALSVAFAATEAAKTEVEALKAGKTAAETALVTERAVPIEKRLSVDAKATPYFTEAVKSRALSVKTLLDAAEGKGKITKPVRAAFEKILSVRHGYALSESGEATAINVIESAEALLSQIPDNAMVPVGEALATAGAAAAAARTPNAPVEASTADIVAEALKKAGFAPATKAIDKK